MISYRADGSEDRRKGNRRRIVRDEDEPLRQYVPRLDQPALDQDLCHVVPFGGLQLGQQEERDCLPQFQFAPSLQTTTNRLLAGAELDRQDRLLTAVENGGAGEVRGRSKRQSTSVHFSFEAGLGR